MKKVLFAIFLTILSLQGHALERQIVVLTSIETPKVKPFWRSNDYEVSKDIESQFAKAFNKSGYKLIISHNTNRETLESYLQSPKTLALFWVSHAADESSIRGMNFSSVIQDIHGNNVKNVFQKINPNIKFLSLIGCNAKNILEDFKNKGLYHTDLVINSFDKKIRLNAGIDEALKASAFVLDSDESTFRKNAYDSVNDFTTSYSKTTFYREAIKGKKELFDTDVKPTKSNEGITFTVYNTNPEYSAELSINSIFIGVLKKDTPAQTFIIPQELVGQKIKLKVDFDVRSLKVTQTLEPLEMDFHDSNFTVDFLKDKNGRPYGRGTNIYYINSEM